MTAAGILIIHFTPPGVIGGVEHIIQQHWRLLEQRGYSVAIVAGRAGGSEPVHVIPELDAASPENAAIEDELAVGVVSPAFHRQRRRILEGLAPFFAECETIIVHNAFSLHFNLPLTAALWALSARRMADSVIAWCHDLAWANPLYIPALRPGYPWDLLRYPAPNVRYITVSDQRRHELMGLWEGERTPVRVVPNGIDVATFLRLSPAVREIEERHKLFDRDLILFLPVRITLRKNVELGIRAIRALKDRGLTVKFLVSGPQAPHHPGRSQTYLDTLRELRAELRLHDEVVFLAEELGRNLAHDELAELYELADALLFPSASEGFGIPILEAGLARVPAVVSAIPILEEVGGADVWTFGLQDEADRIAGEILTALDSRPARLRRRVIREFRWDAVMDRHIVPLLSGASDTHQFAPEA